MKHTIPIHALFLLTIPCSLFPIPSSAAVTLKWTVETSRVQPAVFDVVRGESIALEATLQSYGKPLEAAPEDAWRIYWQTNGMGKLWWSAPARATGNVLRASWTPAMDPGAPAVTGFIGSTGDNYRAAFQLRFRHGPGATPNALPLPTPRIDFAAVEVANAPWAAAEDVAAVASDVSRLGVGYARLYGFATGATNANFSATNYPPTAAEAETRCHYRPEEGMDFSKVPASLQLNELRDGAWRTVVDTRDWPVWYYAYKETRLTNEIARLSAENAALSNRLERANAWGGRTANGVENPMADTVVVDRPNMWLMADYEWQRCVSGSNQCFVIRAKNVAISGGANTNGFLEICDAFGKPYMRINKSAETLADPVFEKIEYDRAEGAWYVVFGNTTKPTKGGANRAIRGNGSGKAILYAEDDPECPATITWPSRPDSVAGHWIMKAVPKEPDAPMFFGAEIKVAGKDYVEYVKDVSFGAGIRVGENVYDAVESGDTLVFRRRK